MTGTLRAGISNKATCRRGGFTLIELIVVIAIVSTVLLIAFPGLSALEGYGFRSDARRLAGLIRGLDDGATTEGVYYRLWLYLDDESIRVESSSDAAVFTLAKDNDLSGFHLGRTTEIEDIVISGLGKVASGEAAVIFNPSVGAEPFSLHLRRGENRLTLSYNPYSGKVRILEGNI